MAHEMITSVRSQGGYYECPRGADGKRKGPLVGYAGKYVDSEGKEKQWVGDIYCNLAVLETEPVLMCHWATILARSVNAQTIKAQIDSGRRLTVCGMPMGGIIFGAALAQATNALFVFPEKKIVEMATSTSREKSKLVFGRHVLWPGAQALLAEDVVNNFSTTGEAIDLIEKQGGAVIGIVGLLNRSPTWDKEFIHKGRSIPVISLVRMPIMEYRQDDPAVADDIKAGNVVFKPKDEWQRLQDVMQGN